MILVQPVWWMIGVAEGVAAGALSVLSKYAQTKLREAGVRSVWATIALVALSVFLFLLLAYKVSRIAVALGFRWEFFIKLRDWTYGLYRDARELLS